MKRQRQTLCDWALVLIADLSVPSWRSMLVAAKARLDKNITVVRTALNRLRTS